MQRQMLWDTFTNRHLPFTNGENRTLDFYIPARWTAAPAPLVVTTTTTSASAAAVSTTVEEVDDTKMWDFTLHKWVPNIMGTEEAEEEAGPKIQVKFDKKKKKKKSRKRKQRSKTTPKRKQIKKKK